MVSPNSLANLTPGNKSKIDARPVSKRLSRPLRQTLKIIADLSKSNETEVLEAIPEIWLTLRACAEQIDPASPLGQRLASLKAVELASAIACSEVFSDDDGDCWLCNSAGYDLRSGGLDQPCLACGGKGDFIETE